MWGQEKEGGLTLHIDDQKRIADGKRGPEADGLRGGEEVPVDQSHRCQVSHQEGDLEGIAQQLGDAVPGGEQEEACPAVALSGVQLVHGENVAFQAPHIVGQEAGQAYTQQQVPCPVGRPLLEVAEAAGDPAAQGILAEQEELAAVRPLENRKTGLSAPSGRGLEHHPLYRGGGATTPPLRRLALARHAGAPSPPGWERGSVRDPGPA